MDKTRSHTGRRQPIPIDRNSLNKNENIWTPASITYGLLLNVDLGKLDAGVLGLELGEVGADELAGSAPSCPVVDNDRLGTRDLGVSMICQRGIG